LRGAVGTGAAFAELIGVERLPEFEQRLGEKLGLSFYPVVNQTYPRKQDYEIIAALAGLGASIHKFAFDLRILQMPPLGEWAEPFGSQQVGSSAMPFKRNPIRAEKMVSLARGLAQMPRIAWDNAAHSLLERTLDDSANRRTLLPEAFLIADELLLSLEETITNLVVDTAAIERNLNTYGPFAASERALLALAKAGGDRQQLHARLREHALTAWAAIQRGESNPLIDLICGDETFLDLLPAKEIQAAMQVEGYVGDAPKRAREFAALIEESLNAS
jgi:adenylosuccinate lyase